MYSKLTDQPDYIIILCRACVCGGGGGGAEREGMWDVARGQVGMGHPSSHSCLVLVDERTATCTGTLASSNS